MNRPLISKSTIIASVALVAAPCIALACPADSLVFSCTTAKQKHIEVCDRGETIQYQFGKIGAAPELSFSVSRNEASTTQWNGTGAMGDTVSIPHNRYVYTVFWGVENMKDVATPESESEVELVAGVKVFKGNDIVSSAICEPDSVQQRIEGINLRPEFGPDI